MMTAEIGVRAYVGVLRVLRPTQRSANPWDGYFQNMERDKHTVPLHQAAIREILP